MRSIRIGNTSGFWGDDPTAFQRMAEYGAVDYLTSDYLAEVSMSVLAKQQQKNNERGYVYDFFTHFESAVEAVIDNQIKVITNAGGNNPLALAKKIQALATSSGFPPLFKGIPSLHF